MSDMHANTELQKMKLREENLRASIKHLEKKAHASNEADTENVQGLIRTMKDKHEKVREHMSALQSEEASSGDKWQKQLSKLDHMMQDIDQEYQKALAYFH